MSAETFMPRRSISRNGIVVAFCVVEFRAILPLTDPALNLANLEVVGFAAIVATDPDAFQVYLAEVEGASQGATVAGRS